MLEILILAKPGARADQRRDYACRWYSVDITPNLEIHVMPPEYHQVQSVPVLARGLHGVSGC